VNSKNYPRKLLLQPNPETIGAHLQGVAQNKAKPQNLVSLHKLIEPELF
jgi:hypothetical protein